MLSLSIIDALANCSINNGVLTLPMLLDDKEHKEFIVSLRNAVLDDKIPMYKPIACKVLRTSLLRVTNIDKEMDESYLGMIPQLREAIVMPEVIPNMNPGNWDIIDDRLNRMFNTSKVISSNLIPSNRLLFTKTIDGGEQTIDIFKFKVHREEFGVDITPYNLVPLLNDSKPIVTINDIDSKMISLELVFAEAIGSVEYIDIEKTIGETKDPYLPVAQLYDLDKYLLVSLINARNNEVVLGYKRDINESVLQAIFRNFAKRLLINNEVNINKPDSTLSCFLRGDVDGMWKGEDGCL